MANVKMVFALSLAIAGGASVARAGDTQVVPTFTEQTKSSGIKSVYAGDWQYMVGGGAAAFDCNGDGRQDLFLAGGAGVSKLYVNRSKVGSALKFSRMRSSVLQLSSVTGAYPLDIDNDGIQDIVVLRVGEDLVFKGLGGCRFAQVNKSWGFQGGDAWSTSFAATWEKGAQWPTIATGTYVDRNEEQYPWGSCTDNSLQRPDPADPKRFGNPVALKPSFCPLSMIFTDWNRSGTPSLRVSNDREYYKGGQEQMWKIEPGKEPTLYTAKEGWRYLRIWGMGIASYDVNSDRYPDYFLTSMADNKLQSLAEVPTDGKVKPSYADVAFAKGVTAHRPYTGGDWHPSTAWHTDFQDMNNDGLVDLFIAKGNVSKMPDFAQKDPNNLLLQQPDGKFVEVGDKAGVASFATSRGAALADFNLDGLVDLVVVNRWENAQVWQNTTKNAGHFIALDVHQSGSNRNAIGSWVEVKLGDKIQRRELTVGGGHAGGSIGWTHFGLGDAKDAEVRVIWPDGTEGGWEKLAGDAFYRIERNEKATAWKAQ